MTLIDELALPHWLRLPDALIAATALEYQLHRLPGNAKHFEPIAALSIEVFGVWA